MAEHTTKHRLKTGSWLLLLILVLVLLGAWIFSSQQNDDVAANQSSNQIETAETSAATINQDGTNVQYLGIDGISALDLLKARTDATTKNSSLGEYVVAINGVDGGGDSYWLYYVNSEAAKVGADQYLTKTGDQIEWRLE